MNDAAPDGLSPERLMPLLSDTEMPYTGNRHLGQCRWFGGDSEEHYLSEGHPLFGLDDIDYSFNRHGYRCPEFTQRNDFDEKHLHLLVLGESHALGVGMPDNRTYASLVAGKLAGYTGRPVQHWNISQGGVGAEYLARLLPTALAVLRPDFVVIHLPPGPQRREYIFDDGNFMHCGERENVAGSIYSVDRHEKTMEAHFEHANKGCDRFNLLKLLIVCQRHLEARDVMWLIIGMGRIPRALRQYVRMDHLVTANISKLRNEAYRSTPALGLARDGRHAGIGPHADMADDIYRHFIEMYARRLGWSEPGLHFETM